MRGIIAIVGLAVAVAACDRPQPVVLNAPPPTPYATPYQYPPPGAAQHPPPGAAQYPPPTPYATPYRYPAAAQYPPPAPEPLTVAEPASNATCFTGPGLPLCVPADQIWHKSATEWYNPSTYCKWGRQQLPERLQKVCSELDRKYPPFKPIWKRFEADNGAVFALEMNNIDHLDGCGGCADAVICVVDNNQCFPPNARRIRFDCHGHYVDVMSGGDMQMAPPRSVIGQMAAVACAGTKPPPN